MKRPLVAAVLVAVVTSLTGCIPGPPGGDVVTQDCAGRDAIVDLPGDYRLTGRCGTVRVVGTDITVEASDAEAVILRGDRIDVMAAAVGRIEITGNDNDVRANDAGGITITGDRNTVGAYTVFGVTIAGNDNQVNAEVTGEIVDGGDRNVVG